MENPNIKLRMQFFAPIVLRVGIGLVVIWFGLQQVSDPSGWIGYLPAWTADMPISQINFVYLNGYFELIFGALLILGFYTRIVSLLLTLHMLGILFSVGYNEIGVRDFGITVGLISIFLHGRSDWSADRLLKTL